MRKTLRYLLFLLAVMAVSVSVLASPIPLGFVSYNLTDPGFAQFNVLNQTGPNASIFPDPTWPVSTSINLSSLNLVVTDSGGGTITYGSGFFTLEPDGLSYAGPTVSDTNTFVMAVLTGTLSPTTATLNSGGTVTFSSSSFTATINDPSGLADGDFAIIYANTVGPTVPEPATLVMLGSGLLGILGARRRRFLR